MQQAGEAVLPGALAVQGGLVAGELVAQRGDGVVRGGQLRGRGGEGGVVPLLVLLADAGGVSAGCLGCGQGGVTLAAGDGDGLFCFGDPGCGSPAFVVQRAAGVTCEFFGMLAGGGLSFHRGDGLGCCGAGLSSVQLGGVPGDRLAGGLGAGLPDLGGGLGADGLSLRFGSLGVAGRGQLAAEGSELVQDGWQLRAQPGAGVVLEAEHTCMTLRGIRAHGATTVTSALLGTLRTDPRSRAEFFALARVPTPPGPM